MFNFNFPQHLYGTATFTPTVTSPLGHGADDRFDHHPDLDHADFRVHDLPLNVTRDASLNSSAPTSCWCSIPPGR